MSATVLPTALDRDIEFVQKSDRGFPQLLQDKINFFQTYFMNQNTKNFLVNNKTSITHKFRMECKILHFELQMMSPIKCTKSSK